MPVENTSRWRCVQTMTVFWCIIVALCAIVGGCFSVFERGAPLQNFTSLASGVPGQGDNVKLVNASVYGTICVVGLAVGMSVVTTVVLAVEKRWLSIVFGTLHLLLCTFAIAIAILAFIARRYAADMTMKMMEHGIRDKYEYTKLDPKKDNWRVFVDFVQINAECCGVVPNDVNMSRGFTFPVKQKIPDEKGKPKKLQRWAWYCPHAPRDRQNCTKMIVPLSCCPRVKTPNKFDPMCAADKSKSIMEVCKFEAIEKLKHVRSLMYFGVLDMALGVMILFLCVALCTISQKTAATNKSDITAHGTAQGQTSVGLAPSSSQSDVSKVDRFRGGRAPPHPAPATRRMDSTVANMRVSSDRLGPPPTTRRK